MCPACGEPAIAAERKVITVLFADLAGYTSIAEALDPEEVLAFVRPWMTELRLIVEEYGGTVPQVMGDGFMAVFGVPNAHEDDAERAVRAGLALTRHGQALANRGAAVGFRGVRVGVNTGEVMVAGSRESSGFAVVGDAVNVSARLAAMAEPGQVICGRPTYQLTRGRLRYGPRVVRAAKGKAAPVATYHALGARTTRAARAVRSSAFVGRTAELRRLLANAEAVRKTGRTRVRVVVAEPGVGKSRLADELGTRLIDFRVFAGASHPYGQRLPLAALAEAIGSAIGVPADSDPHRARRIIARQLRRRKVVGAELVGAQAQLEGILGLIEPTNAGDAATDRPGGLAVDAAQAAREAIRLLATGGPALVILDDLHWADPDQLALLADIHRAPWSEPVLFLALARPEPEDWRRGLPTITLGGLPADSARQIISSAIGPGVPPPVAQRLIERAAGNPLFLEESARMLVERGALERRGSGWILADTDALERVPTSLRQLVAARIDRLPAPAKRAAQDASIAGEVTWDVLIARLSAALRLGGDAAESLAELEARDILRRRPTSTVAGAVELEFKHAVLRDVAYESLPRAERALRHELTADWLREVQGEPAVASIAHHFERAWELARSTAAIAGGSEGRVAAMAATYLRRWGDSVFSVQPRLALSLYERGMRMADAEPEAVESNELARLLVGRAEGLSEAGRHHEAIVAAERALDTTEAAAAVDGADAQTEAVRALALLALARAHSDQGTVATARTLIGEALAIFERTGDVLGQARAYHRLAEAQRFGDLASQVAAYRRAYALYARARAARERAVVAEDLAYLLTVVGGREAGRWLERASRFAERSGDERGRAAVRRAGAYSALYRGDLDAALDAALQARGPAATIGHRWIEVDSLLVEALVRSAAGSPLETLKIVRRLLAIADSVGARHLRALVLGAGARAAQRDGHPRRAERWLAAMRTILGDLGAVMEMAEVDLLEATLHLERGAWERVADPARAGERGARASGWRLLRANGPLLRGRAHLGAGRLSAAERELRHAARLARSTGATGPALVAEAALRQAIEWRTDMSAGATPADAAPSPDQAAAVARRSRLSAREPTAIDLESEGLRALRSGDNEAAVTAFGRAVRAWQLLGLTVWQARAERFRAQALEASGRSSAARASTRRAQQILARLGSPLYRPS
jgi:class 3 adenylate cyclase/tetratricopeptide (TPR) repeat protein